MKALANVKNTQHLAVPEEVTTEIEEKLKAHGLTLKDVIPEGTLTPEEVGTLETIKKAEEFQLEAEKLRKEAAKANTDLKVARMCAAFQVPEADFTTAISNNDVALGYLTNDRISNTMKFAMLQDLGLKPVLAEANVNNAPKASSVPGIDNSPMAAADRSEQLKTLENISTSNSIIGDVMKALEQGL